MTITIMILLFEVMVLGVMCFPRERMLRERYNVVETLNNAFCALLLLEVCLLLPETMVMFYLAFVYFVAEKGWLSNQP
jgi:hypothetical protein